MSSLIPKQIDLPVEEVPTPTTWGEVRTLLGGELGQITFITTPEGDLWLCDSSLVGQEGNERASVWLSLRGEARICGGNVLYMSKAEESASPWLYQSGPQQKPRKRSEAHLPPGNWKQLKGGVPRVKDHLMPKGLIWDQTTRGWWIPEDEFVEAQSMVDRGTP